MVEVPPRQFSHGHGCQRTSSDSSDSAGIWGGSGWLQRTCQHLKRSLAPCQRTEVERIQVTHETPHRTPPESSRKSHVRVGCRDRRKGGRRVRSSGTVSRAENARLNGFPCRHLSWILPVGFHAPVEFGHLTRARRQGNRRGSRRSVRLVTWQKD